MAHESSYVPGNVVEKWIDDRLPIIRWSKEHLMDFPTPKNLNYWWTFGGILALHARACRSSPASCS
jgi:quinol-cytochrome oxidoreductase complex cytochrome b subunit